jgi:hypothetical protein
MEDRRIAFRVGINIGDVIVEPHDIFGDGVNIAARLEGIAEPGVSAFRLRLTNRLSAKSRSNLSIWARRASRILPIRCTPMPWSRRRPDNQQSLMRLFQITKTSTSPANPILRLGRSHCWS